MTAFHVFVALTLIIVVLFQHGKGASIGASFGGSSQTLFGPRGPATALAKITTAAAVLFMVTSILLSTISNKARESSVIDALGDGPAPIQTTLPDLGGQIDSEADVKDDFGGPLEQSPSAKPAVEDSGGPVERPADSR